LSETHAASTGRAPTTRLSGCILRVLQIPRSSDKRHCCSFYRLAANAHTRPRMHSFGSASGLPSLGSHSLRSVQVRVRTRQRQAWSPLDASSS
jgi:hypothetical protein